MSEQHTPGRFEIKHSGRGLFIVRSIDLPAPHEIAAAQCRLANAAPQMLEALREMLELFAHGNEDIYGVRIARAAIARATGGTP